MKDNCYVSLCEEHVVVAVKTWIAAVMCWFLLSGSSGFRIAFVLGIHRMWFWATYLGCNLAWYVILSMAKDSYGNCNTLSYDGVDILE